MYNVCIIYIQLEKLSKYWITLVAFKFVAVLHIDDTPEQKHFSQPSGFVDFKLK